MADKVRFVIYWIKDGAEDYTMLVGDTIEDVQEQAQALVERVQPQEYWSLER